MLADLRLDQAWGDRCQRAKRLPVGELRMSSVLIRIVLSGLAGAIVGYYLTYVGVFLGFALGLFLGAAVLLWLTQRNLPHPARPRSPLPPMTGP
jgi:hypothetical protein